MSDEQRPRFEELADPTINLDRRKRLHDDLLRLEHDIEIFLDGEISRGLITAYKLTAIVAARNLRAVAQTSRQDLVDNRVDLG